MAAVAAAAAAARPAARARSKQAVTPPPEKVDWRNYLGVFRYIRRAVAAGVVDEPRAHARARDRQPDRRHAADRHRVRRQAADQLDRRRTHSVAVARSPRRDGVGRRGARAGRRARRSRSARSASSARCCASSSASASTSRSSTRRSTLELTQFEDSELYDKLTRARREASSRPLSLVSQTFELGQSMVTLIGLGGLLAAFSPIALAVLVAAAIPPFIAELKFSGDAFRLSRWRTPETREQMYVEMVIAQDAYAKEVKLFGLGPRFLDRYRAIFEKLYAGDRPIAINRGLWALVLGTLGQLAFYGMYLWIAFATIDNDISFGDMTMYVLVFKQAQSALSSALGDVGGMYEDNLYMSNLYEFLDTPTITTSGTATVGTDAGRRRALRARHVRVPGLERARARQRRPPHPARQQARDRRRERLGQDHADQAAHPALRADRRPDHARRPRPPRVGPLHAPPPHRRHLPGLRALPAHGRREHRRRRRSRVRGPRALGRRRRPRPREAVHRRPSRHVRHAARQVVPRRPRAVARPVAEGRARALVHAQGRRRPRARRADRLDGRRGRGQDLRAVPRADRRQDRDRDLAPVLDGAHGRPDHRARPRPDHRARLARRARRGRRPLRDAVQPAGPGLPLGNLPARAVSYRHAARRRRDPVRVRPDRTTAVRGELVGHLGDDQTTHRDTKGRFPQDRHQAGDQGGQARRFVVTMRQIARDVGEDRPQRERRRALVVRRGPRAPRRSHHARGSRERGSTR